MSVVPVAVDDPINAKILSVSEDKVQGFQRDPLGHIAKVLGLEVTIVVERIRAMLESGTIRRVRQTLMTTNLAPGALVAWQVPADRLNEAFDFMFQEDPFSGHVVIRSTDKGTPGSEYRLWTTLKVPIGFSMTRHCEFLSGRIGATDYKLMPAKKLFALGVGHVRRRNLAPGSRSTAPARVLEVRIEHLSEPEWRLLMSLKREFQPEEIVPDPPGLWAARADEASVTLEEFYRVAENLCERHILGRFSTFLEHVKKLSDGTTVTKYNALFHWAVPPGHELDAGSEVGRHHVMTHAYWREAGPQFNHTNIMGVAHGTDRDWLLAHKIAIDRHLEEAGIAIEYTNVFWGGRSEIKPSEISPTAYQQWCRQIGLDPASLRGQVRDPR